MNDVLLASTGALLTSVQNLPTLAPSAPAWRPRPETRPSCRKYTACELKSLSTNLSCPGMVIEQSFSLEEVYVVRYQPGASQVLL